MVKRCCSQVRELSNALSGALGIKLPVTLAYDYPNVEAMATFILSKLKIKDVAAAPIVKLKPAAASKAKPAAAKPAAGSSPTAVAAGTPGTLSLEPLAVLGMACRLPGASGTAEIFWGTIASGTDCIVTVPADRWDIEKYYDADKSVPGTMNSRFGGFLPEVEMFDPMFFGISPREAVSMDPQQRLLMETSWETMENAGRAPNPNVAEQIGVFVGATTFDYQLRKARIPAGEVDSFWGTGSSNSVTAGRISYTFGYQGPCLACDTACSSALVAMDLACKSVRTGTSDSALAGGVSLLIEPDLSINFAKAGMLSPDGRCHTFDAGANGYVRGEGAGMMFVELESAAVSAGSHVLCLVRGSAINQDGRVSGLTVPNGPSQEDVVSRAIADGAIDRDQIGYVEAHGTGTPLGDPIEVNSLVGGFAGRPRPLVVGAVKTNIGHLEGAAGIAGMIKLALCVEKASIPPNLHFKSLNPSIDLEDTPIIISSNTTKWPAGYGSCIGGVSSFGFSGTNGHVIIEGVANRPGPISATMPRDWHVLALAALSGTALNALSAEVAAYAEANPTVRVADVCHALNLRGSFNNKLALVVSNDVSDLAAKLKAAASGPGGDVYTGTASDVGRNIAMVFADGANLSINDALYDLLPGYAEGVDLCDSVTVRGARGAEAKVRISPPWPPPPLRWRPNGSSDCCPVSCSPV